MCTTKNPYNEKPPVPMVTFQDKVEQYLERVAPILLKPLDKATHRFLTTIGTKLEPILQITPATSVPALIGFEALAMGRRGETFHNLCECSCAQDSALLRMVLCVNAFNTAYSLRNRAAQNGVSGARHLIFTVNLDPEMLMSPYIEELLEANYETYADGKVLFEISEKTSVQCLDRLKCLQVDFSLKFCADDLNRWSPLVRETLEERVEVTKFDAPGFLDVIARRGDAPGSVIEQIAACQFGRNALIVEGIQEKNYWRFLETHWESEVGTALWGQGYALPPGHPWDTWTMDLKRYGLPGGHVLVSETIH